MAKEKFDRSKAHINIGEIKTENNGNMVAQTIMHVQNSFDNYNQMILEKLINEYGEEEGKKRFEILKQESNERFKEYQNIDFSPEQDEDSVNFSKRR